MDIGAPDTGAIRLFGVPDSTAEVYPAAMTVAAGELVLEAVPAPGYLFDSWSGDLSDAANPTTIIMDCNKNVTANFSKGGFQVRWPVVDWSLSGLTIGCLVLAGLLVTVLIVRR